MVGLSGEEGARAMQRRDAGGDQRGEVDLSLLGDEYDSVERIGEGSEGVVYIVTSREAPRKRFAIKAYKTTSKKGVSTAAIREIGLLRDLDHENVVRLHKVHVLDSGIFLACEACSTDLQQVIKHHLGSGRPIPEYTLKSVLWQILRGVDYLHANWVMHRDLKPDNILLDGREGKAKIGDFGLARVFKDSLQPLKSNGVVVTLWYRAPELLLGAQHYTPAVDVWAVGCLFGELLRLRPLFHAEQRPGTKFQVKQMERILNVLGVPRGKSAWSDLPHWKHNTDKIAEYKPPKGKARKIETMVGLDKGSRALSLLRRLLEYDPAKRISAQQALEHEYFRTQPFPGSSFSL